MICVSEPSFPGCVVLGRAVGLLEMSDEEGPDNHVLCVPCDDPGWSEVNSVADIPAQVRREISHFFEVYKDLDPKRHASAHRWSERDAAVREIQECKQRHSARAGV